MIGILILVHQHVAKALLVTLENIWLFLPEPADQKQEVVKIQGIVLAQTAAVFLVHSLQCLLQKITFQAKGGGFDELVLGRADIVAKNLIADPFPKPHLQNNLFDEALLVIAVVNHELSRVPQVQFFYFKTQDARADRMKSAHGQTPHLPSPTAGGGMVFCFSLPWPFRLELGAESWEGLKGGGKRPLDPGPHLAGGFVRESQRQHFFRSEKPLLQQINNPVN